MNPFDDDEEFDLIVDQILTNTIQATELIIQYIENGEAEPSNPRPRGPNKDRGREDGHDKLVADYFSDNPVYDDEDFKRRFRMSRRLFVRIVSDLEREFDCFKQQWDARGVKGFSPLQKCIINLYMRQYLRKPTASDIQAIYALHEQQHGLPGMLGSIDCMHWDWKNCPVAWRGQFHRGDHQGPTVILEAVASYDEWIWHAFFGVPGATNDIIVVNQSPIFNDLFENKAPDSSFVANDTHYHHGYYLADGIYPEWTTFVKAFRYPTEVSRLQFTTRQESARKDIERTFATLKSSGKADVALRWQLVQVVSPARLQMALLLIFGSWAVLALGDFDEALTLLDHSCSEGIEINAFLFNAILGEAVWKAPLIRILIIQDRIDIIEFVMDRMLKEKVRPDAATCGYVFSIYVNRGFHNTAMEALQVMSICMLSEKDINENLAIFEDEFIYAEDSGAESRILDHFMDFEDHAVALLNLRWCAMHGSPISWSIDDSPINVPSSKGFDDRDRYKRVNFPATFFSGDTLLRRLPSPATTTNTKPTTNTATISATTATTTITKPTTNTFDPDEDSDDDRRHKPLQLPPSVGFYRVG
ncbi:hypothetical protein OSB04_019088 [Centaurea solstitialis]|uniref:Uncharacterized protein n=1 Tax=Centaurea solstitialis TaxID=347529 RepID=A0AA38WC19_9ASTR|nr:hypothetical protein OSB04_019088 [Centaurea solstitialis]